MKNSMLRTAAVMLALVLLTSCFVGSTFAKYVTTGNASDSARIAKFGVEISAIGNEAFNTEYSTDDDDYSGSLSVQSDVKVVAPGTTGRFASLELSGTPEVAVRVEYTFDMEIPETWVNEAGDCYFPIVIYVNGIGYVGSAIGGDGGYTSTENFISNIQRGIADFNAEYAPGTDLSADAPALNISWAWPFEHNSDWDAIGGHQNDTDDTYLGDLAAEDNAPEFSITVSATVTQID